MGFLSITDFFRFMGIPHKSVDELKKMTPEELADHYRINCRSCENDDPDFYTGEDLMLFWDDRWMNDK